VIGHEEKIWGRTFSVLQKWFYEYRDRLAYDLRYEGVSCIFENTQQVVALKYVNNAL